MSEHELIPFTPKDIIKYLDKCINFWRKIRDNNNNTKENRLQAIDYIDAYQSVRTSLFGTILEAEEGD